MEEAESLVPWQHLIREDNDQFRLDCRGVRAAGAANNLLQPTDARAAWSSYVLISGFVPSFSDLLASGRAMSAQQGRYERKEMVHEHR